MMNSILAFLKIYRVHFIAWGIFVLYEGIIVTIMSGYYANIYNYLIQYCLNISVFYIHACWLLPLAFKQKENRVWKIPLYLLLEVSIILAVIYFIDISLIKYTDIMELNTFTPPIIYSTDILIILSTNIMPLSPITPTSMLVSRIIWRIFYMMMAGTGYYFFTAYKRERDIKEEALKNQYVGIIEKQRIENDLAIAKNAYLKAQINPHFLFNTLDFIYHDVIKHSNKSADAVLGLVENMRYALDIDYFGDYVDMGLEIEQVKTLINLHKLRSDGKEAVDIHIEEGLESFKIIPLAILTLVENMFKHGNLKEEAGHLIICTINESIVIRTKNKMYVGRKINGFGSGLKNIEQRLLNTYKDEAKLGYNIDEDDFKVTLSIPVSE